MLKSDIVNQPCFIGGRFQAGSYDVAKWSNFDLIPVLQFADQNPGKYVISGHKITVPKTGYYKISEFYSVVDAGFANGLKILRHNQDGTYSYLGGETHSGATFTFGYAQVLVSLSAGEQISFAMYCDNAGTITIRNDPGQMGGFSIEYLGGGLKIYDCFSIYSHLFKRKEEKIC